MFADFYFGNGKPGLVTRMKEVEGAVERIEEVIEAFRGYAKWIIGLIVTLLLKEAIIYLTKAAIAAAKQ